jgi:hypothetical protein
MCLIAPLSVALVKGDLKTMFAYVDHEEPKPNDSSNASTVSETETDNKKSN